MRSAQPIDRFKYRPVAGTRMWWPGQTRDVLGALAHTQLRNVTINQPHDTRRRRHADARGQPAYSYSYSYRCGEEKQHKRSKSKTTDDQTEWTWQTTVEPSDPFQTYIIFKIYNELFIKSVPRACSPIVNKPNCWPAHINWISQSWALGTTT